MDVLETMAPPQSDIRFPEFVTHKRSSAAWVCGGLFATLGCHIGFCVLVLLLIRGLWQRQHWEDDKLAKIELVLQCLGIVLGLVGLVLFSMIAHGLRTSPWAPADQKLLVPRETYGSYGLYLKDGRSFPLGQSYYCCDAALSFEDVLGLVSKSFLRHQTTEPTGLEDAEWVEFSLWMPGAQVTIPGFGQQEVNVEVMYSAKCDFEVVYQPDLVECAQSLRADQARMISANGNIVFLMTFGLFLMWSLVWAPAWLLGRLWKNRLDQRDLRPSGSGASAGSSGQGQAQPLLTKADSGVQKPEEKKDLTRSDTATSGDSHKSMPKGGPKGLQAAHPNMSHLAHQPKSHLSSSE